MKVSLLELPHGRIAYSDTGSGPLVVCVPGMGDVRGLYRFLTPRLVSAGYRVVTMDVRGHGGSSVGWPSYTAGDIGGDVVALLRHLDAGPAVVVGESMAAGAAVWAAAEAPELVAGIALSGPFVRSTPVGAFARLAVGLVGRSRWLWSLYYKSLYPTAPPGDLSEYRKALRANLAEPGRIAALRGMLAAPKSDSEERLDGVRCPVLVLMGTKDPDFKDPSAEATWIGDRLAGTVVMISGAGHYPVAEFPTESADALLPFLARALSGDAA